MDEESKVHEPHTLDCTLECSLLFLLYFWTKGEHWNVCTSYLLQSPSLKHTHTSWIIYIHYFLTHINLSPPQLLWVYMLCVYASMCAWMCVFAGMWVFHCVCVHVQWCTWACIHCVLVVYRFLQWQALQQLTHTLRRQRFNLQEAQLCTKTPTPAQDSKHSSVTNGTELLAATTPPPTTVNSGHKPSSYPVCWTGQFSLRGRQKEKSHVVICSMCPSSF